MDKADGSKRIVVAVVCLWDCLPDQFHCNLLPCIKSHTIWDHGKLITYISSLFFRLPSSEWASRREARDGREYCG